MGAVFIPKIIQKDLLYTLIPHKDKMFLLDSVVDWGCVLGESEKRFLSSIVKIKKDSFFFDKALNGVPSYVAFEYMAQSISAISGIQGTLIGQKPKLGMILSVSNLKTFVDVFVAGDTVKTTVLQDCKIDLLYTFTAKTYIKHENDTKQILATQANLTVMEADVSFFQNKNL